MSIPNISHCSSRSFHSRSGTLYTSILSAVQAGLFISQLDRRMPSLFTTSWEPYGALTSTACWLAAQLPPPHLRFLSGNICPDHSLRSATVSSTIMSAGVRLLYSTLVWLLLQLTAKSRYYETIDLLHIQHTFNIRENRALIILKQTVPPAHFSLVRTIEIDLAFVHYMDGNMPRIILPSPVGDDMRTWEQACDIMKSLRHLQRLRVHLRHLAGTMYAINEHYVYFLLHPLLAVRVRDFVASSRMT